MVFHKVHAQTKLPFRFRPVIQQEQIHIQQRFKIKDQTLHFNKTEILLLAVFSQRAGRYPQQFAHLLFHQDIFFGQGNDALRQFLVNPRNLLIPFQKLRFCHEMNVFHNCVFNNEGRKHRKDFPIPNL